MQTSTLRRALAFVLVIAGAALLFAGLHAVYAPAAPIVIGTLAIAGGLLLDDGTGS